MKPFKITFHKSDGSPVVRQWDALSWEEIAIRAEKAANEMWLELIEIKYLPGKNTFGVQL